MIRTHSKFWLPAILSVALISVCTFTATASVRQQRQDTVRTSRRDSIYNQPYKPSIRPTYRLRDRYGDPFSNRTSRSPIFLKDPTKLDLDIRYDSSLNYTIYERIGTEQSPA